MKAGMFLACAVAAVATAGSNAQPAEAATVKRAHATAPKAHDWSRVVSETPAGGFVMGNPDAKVKLVEYGSMTCPHCAHFDETAMPSIVKDYVKTGEVSFEFRNYVRDAVDVTASLVARCGGAKSFFPLTEALFKQQRTWGKKVADAPQDQLTKVDALPPETKFVAVAKLAGLQRWGAAHGLPLKKSSQCLTDEKALDQLVQMASDATTQFPQFAGTPSFLINGEMVEFGAITAAEVWPTLEGKIRSALGRQSATADPSTTNGAKN